MQQILLVLFIFLNSITFSQKFLALDAYHLWKVKRVCFYTGENLTFKFKGSGIKETKVISDLKDSIIYFTDGDKIKLCEIKYIYIDHSNYLTRKLRKFFIAYGILFIVLDTFNNAIHPEIPGPIVKTRAVIIGASVAIVGLLIKLMEIKRWKPGRNKTLKIIDLNPV